MSPDPSMGHYILQIIMIVIYAFFTMSQISVAALNENRIKRMYHDGDKKAKKLMKLLDHSVNFWTTIQVCLIISAFILSSFVVISFLQKAISLLKSLNLEQHVGISGIEIIAAAMIIAIVAIINMLFGVVIPMMVARKNPEKTALMIAAPMSIAFYIFKPLVVLLTTLSYWILRLVGINTKEDNDAVTEDEIRMMVETGEEKGTIDASERAMIDNIFEFNDITVADLMTHRKDVIYVSSDDEDSSIMETIKGTGLSRFPVFGDDADDIKGILYTKDFLINRLSDDKKPIAELMRKPFFVPEAMPANKLFGQMQIKQNHIAIVVDEYGGTYGVVTMEDLLEQIVGNIYDEYDPKEVEFVKLEDGVFRISGGMDLKEVESLIEIELPTDEFDTLGGYIFSYLNVIPDDGETPIIECGPLLIKIEHVVDRRIEWAIVKALK